MLLPERGAMEHVPRPAGGAVSGDGVTLNEWGKNKRVGHKARTR